MPDKEETRLLAAVTECHRLNLVAWSALQYPVHSVVNGSAAHGQLVVADATARLLYAASKTPCRLIESLTRQKYQSEFDILYPEPDTEIAVIACSSGPVLPALIAGQESGPLYASSNS